MFWAEQTVLEIKTAFPGLRCCRGFYACAYVLATEMEAAGVPGGFPEAPGEEGRAALLPCLASPCLLLPGAACDGGAGRLGAPRGQAGWGAGVGGVPEHGPGRGHPPHPAL